jgi:hypothetical protein
MRRVVSYCKRHLAQEAHLKETKSLEELEKTKSTRSLKNWVSRACAASRRVSYPFHATAFVDVFHHSYLWTKDLEIHLCWRFSLVGHLIWPQYQLHRERSQLNVAGPRPAEERRRR